MAKYITSENQSVYDICIIIYRTYDFLDKLLTDNPQLDLNIIIPVGTSVDYPDEITIDSNRITTGIGFVSIDILDEPDPYALVCNTITTLTVESTNLGTFTWQRSNSSTGPWNNIPNSSLYSGVNSNQLRINNVPIYGSTFYYRCILNNLIITDIFERIAYEPVISTFTGPTGSIFEWDTFTVSLSTTSPSPTFTWQYSSDNSTWNNINNFTILGTNSIIGGTFSGATSSILTFHNCWRFTNSYYFRGFVNSGPCSSINNFIISNQRYAPDIENFHDALYYGGGTWSNVEKLAVVSLFNNLSSAYPKMLAVYPFIGGSSYSQSLNLVNPSTYQLVYTGTPTFTSKGMQASTGNFADTQLNAAILTTSNHFSFYNTATSSSLSGAMGTTRLANPNTFLYLGSVALQPVPNQQNHASGGAVILDGYTYSTKQGFWLGNRTSSALTDVWIQQGGISHTCSNTYDPTPVNNTYKIGKSGVLGSDLRFGFASIGYGLSQSESQVIYISANTFNTTLGRN